MSNATTRDRLGDHPRMPRIGGKVANRYEIIDLIGEGGFAVVYRARDTQLGGLVALKVLEPAKSMDQAFTKRFEQEINLVRELRQHNTIKIWDAGKTEWDCHYYAMELVEGEELGQLVNRSGGLPLDRVVRIISQVLRSLGEAHKAGIIHRDLKPGNIMVCQLDDEPDYVKVLDFGIAKARSAELTKVKTQTGMVMCTPNYAAPELLRNQDLTPAADLYALGLIMAEMVTGRQVVQADSLVDIIGIQASAVPLPLDPQLLRLPIGGVIAKATAKPVDERYQSAPEMLAALRALGNQPPAPMPAPPTPGIGVPDAIALMETSHISAPRTARAPAPVPIVARSNVPRYVLLVALLLTAILGAVLGLLLTGGEREADEYAVIAEPNPAQSVGAAEGNRSARTTIGSDSEIDTRRNGRVETAEPAVVPQERQPEPAMEEVLIEDAPEALTPVVVVDVPTPETNFAATEESSVVAGPEISTTVAAEGETGEAERVPDGEAIQTAAAESNQVRLLLTSQPSGVRVYVDGESLGRTPLDEIIEPGGPTVEVTLRKTDYRTARFEILASDSLFERDVRMRREAVEREASPTFAPPPI